MRWILLPVNIYFWLPDQFSFSMNRYSIRIILLVIFLLGHFKVSAGDSGVVMILHRNVIINYDFERSSRNSNSNEMLKDLAGDAVKSLKSTRISIDFDLKLEFETSAGNNCKLKVGLVNPVLSGDHLFRGFDVTDVLLPDFIDFVLAFFTKKDSSGYREFAQENYPVARADSNNLKLDFGCPDPGKDSIQLVSLSPNYDENALDGFRSRLNLIHDYYASCALIDSLQTLANSMNLQNEAHFPEYFVFLEEINKAVEIIGEKKFEDALNLSVYDPKNFIRKYTELFKFSKSLTMTFEERLEQAQFIHPSANVDSVITVFLSGLMRYINWTLLVNDRNGSIYQEYLETYYVRPAFGDDLAVLKKVMNKISPDVDADTLLSQLFHKIFVSYQRRAEELMKENLFAEAIELIENAKQFSKFNPFPEPAEFDKSARDKAANGIFDSYLSVASSSIRSRRYDMAETYLSKARGYRASHSASLTNDTVYQSVFMQLVKDQMVDCDSLSSKGRFMESLDCFLDLQSGYDSTSLALILPRLENIKEHVYVGIVKEMLQRARKFSVIHDPDSAIVIFDLAVNYAKKLNRNSTVRNSIDSMQQGFDKLKYAQFIDKAGYHFRRRDYARAYTTMNSAEEISGKYHFARDPAFDSLWHLLYPHYLQYLLISSEKIIWSNKLQEAGKFADSIAGLQEKSGLGSDQGLSLEIERYRSKISQKVCSDAMEQIELFEVRSTHYIERKNFRIAEMLLDSAVKVSDGTKACHTEMGSLTDTIRKYQEASTFQQFVIDADNQAAVNHFRDALVQYQKAETFFTSHSIARFGLTCEPFLVYVKGKSNSQITFAAMELYLAGKEARHAFECLNLYRLQDGDPVNVKEMQRSIGMEMANSDFLTMPEKDPATLVETYTGNDKWLSGFEHAYLSRWNNLKSGVGSKEPARN